MEEILSFVEGLLVAAAKYAVGNIESLLAQLRQNIQLITLIEVRLFHSLAVEMLELAAFIELLFLVKHVIFSTNAGLQTMLSNNTLYFKEL